MPVRVRGRQRAVRLQLAAYIDDLVLLDDPDRQQVRLHPHRSTGRVDTILPAPVVRFRSADELSGGEQRFGRRHPRRCGGHHQPFDGHDQQSRPRFDAARSRRVGQDADEDGPVTKVSPVPRPASSRNRSTLVQLNVPRGLRALLQGCAPGGCPGACSLVYSPSVIPPPGSAVSLIACGAHLLHRATQHSSLMEKLFSIEDVILVVANPTVSIS
jgi:hypothetical protein